MFKDASMSVLGYDVCKCLSRLYFWVWMGVDTKKGNNSSDHGTDERKQTAEAQYTRTPHPLEPNRIPLYQCTSPVPTALA